jgi:hypothetical protein
VWPDRTCCVLYGLARLTKSSWGREVGASVFRACPIGPSKVQVLCRQSEPLAQRLDSAQRDRRNSEFLVRNVGAEVFECNSKLTNINKFSEGGDAAVRQVPFESIPHVMEQGSRFEGRRIVVPPHRRGNPVMMPSPIGSTISQRVCPVMLEFSHAWFGRSTEAKRDASRRQRRKDRSEVRGRKMGVLTVVHRLDVNARSD